MSQYTVALKGHITGAAISLKPKQQGGMHNIWAKSEFQRLQKTAYIICDVMSEVI